MCLLWQMSVYYVLEVSVHMTVLSTVRCVNFADRYNGIVNACMHASCLFYHYVHACACMCITGGHGETIDLESSFAVRLAIS